MKTFAAIITVVILAVAGYLVYLNNVTTVESDPPILAFPPAHEEEPVETPVPTEVEVPPDPTSLEAEGLGPVPDLEESDAYLKEVLDEEPGWNSILSSKNLIRKAVTAVELLSRGENPTSQVGFLQPKVGFKYVEKDETLWLSPENYERYEPLMAFISGLDMQRGALFYRHLFPVLSLAYDELGNGDQALPQKLDAVMQQVLEFTPPEGEIELAGKDGTYIFTNEELENATHLHKALVRMGPANVLALQEKIRQFRQALSDK